jgi:hypothetical protein
MDDAPKISAEQAADLAALQAAINEQPAGAPGAAAPGFPGEPVKVDLQTEFTGMIKLAVAALSPAFPSLSDIYTDQVTAAASSAAAQVCMKHGWLTGGIGGKWAEEIAAAAILLPLGYQTYQGISSDLARAKKSEPSAPIPNETPSAKTVTFGAAVDAMPEPRAA